ncbi:MAG: hypothetical protein DRP90_03925 [Planctomycetota bacterium]|nr:MAG: hypothetical protein DRP90_03925 [Planctomycetota bacterium]
MTARKVDPEFSLRLIESTFLLETGINISLMFCLETLMVDTSLLAENYRRKAISNLQEMLSTNELVSKTAERINEFYTATFGDSPSHLDSILSILDGPISFEASFYFAVLDPDLRTEIRFKCLETAPRYRGNLTDAQARNLLEIVFRTCDELLYKDRRFSVLLTPEKREELERDFKEYLKRYKDSTQDEIQSRKVKVKIAYEGDKGPAMPVGLEEEPITDWRSFCRRNYLSDRFSIFPELLEHDVTSLTAQESLFLPRRAVISRPLEDKRVKVVDGIRYCRERLARKSPKLLNLHGPRGNGLSAFARMLTVSLASAYSRRRSGLVPLYIDLHGRTSSDLANLSDLIDSEILRRNEELTGSWQTSPTVLIFDNFDRVAFADEQERDRYLSSFLHLAVVLRGGGVVVVTDDPVETRKIGVEVELVTLYPFDEVNIRDWIKSWSEALGRTPLPVERLSAEVLEAFNLPLNLWCALNFAYEDLRRMPSMGLTEFAEHLVRRMAKYTAETILVMEHRAVDPAGITAFCKELAWHNYLTGRAIGDADTLRQMLKAARLDISPHAFLKAPFSRLVDVRGNRFSPVWLEVPNELLVSWLVARRFLENVKARNFLNLLGRPLNEQTFDMIVDMLEGLEELEGEPRVEVLRKIRDTLRHWFRYNAIAVLPKRLSKQGVAFSDLDVFPDFKLVCLLLWSEVTRMLGDDRPLPLPPRSLSQLIKALQVNPSPDRLDFRRYLAGLTLKGVEFSDIDLEGADFSRCNLADAKFLRCNLRNVSFRGADMVGGTFENCSLKDSDFSESDLSGCTIRYCDLSGAAFRDSRIDASRLHYASFRGSGMVGTTMSKSSCSMVDFTSANMTGARMSDSTFERVDFSRAKMVGAVLDSSLFDASVFKETNMTVASALKCNFRGSIMDSTGMAGVNAQNSRFEGVATDSLDLEEALLHKAAFADVRLRRARLRKADLTGARLPRADLREADLTSANLTMADLNGAMLDGAVGLGTLEKVEGANITGCSGISPLEKSRLKRLGAIDTPDTGVFRK